MANPVSILFPCYEINTWLIDALASVELAGKKIESECVIVANNMSEFQIKELHEVCRRNLTIRYKIVNAGRTNLVGALNFGLEFCDYDLIARMDQDDIMHENRLIHQVDFMDSHQDHVLVGSSVEVINEFGEFQFIQRYPASATEISRKLQTQNCFAHPSVMYRKSEVINAGKYSDVFLHAEDYDLFLKLNAIGKCSNIDLVLLKYRKSQKQVSSIHRVDQMTSMKALIVWQAVKTIGLESSFGLPSEHGEIRNWIRALSIYATKRLFVFNHDEFVLRRTLGQAISNSHLAVVRTSGGVVIKEMKSVAWNLMMAFFFSPINTLKFCFMQTQKRLFSQGP